ncbi:MAG: DUF285 domain-containing protein [Clostridia bacterium]|nr:DUF285 domain-containing protein [Clostridia bacterium]
MKFLINKRIENKIRLYKFFPKEKADLVNIIASLLKDKIYDFNCIDTSNITDMAYLFQFACSKAGMERIGCQINVSTWDVSNVYNMRALFANSVIDINPGISDWNVSKVRYMENMFNSVDKFDANLENWDVSNVETMNFMFSNCYIFKGEGLKNWNVKNLTYSSYMFISCKTFNEDISNWNIDNIRYMQGMFNGCISFNQNLSKWKIYTSMTNIDKAFSSCLIHKSNKPQIIYC